MVRLCFRYIISSLSAFVSKYVKSKHFRRHSGATPHYPLSTILISFQGSVAANEEVLVAIPSYVTKEHKFFAKIFAKVVL